MTIIPSYSYLNTCASINSNFYHDLYFQHKLHNYLTVLSLNTFLSHTKKSKEQINNQVMIPSNTKPNNFNLNILYLYSAMLPLAKSLDCVHVDMYMWCVSKCAPKLVWTTNTTLDKWYFNGTDSGTSVTELTQYVLVILRAQNYY